MSELTIQDTTEYMRINGCPDNNGEWLLAIKRPDQAKEAIQNNYCLTDFDRWQQIQDVLFGNGTESLDWETSQKIIDLLYEKDIEVLELCSFKDQV